MENSQFADNNFIRSIVDNDLKNHKYTSIITRFPPEPNGYLHIGHVKSICLNFGLAIIYDGLCNLRFDDTNPEKESDEFVLSIEEDIEWLGFKWDKNAKFASNYFDALYQYAHELIDKNLAYVDDLTPEEMRIYRGTLNKPGKDSPYKTRSISENKELFIKMKNGEFPDGSKTLRLKIDMQSSNINLRDPVIYRIKRTTHHRTGDNWYIYPMYDYTHCISDALEHITHSLCTLEFEDHRPLYDWIIEHVSVPSIPHQYEFSRLELMYSITSKRKLHRLVEEKYVNGWDDPRMPTISGMRRRGYTPNGLILFSKRIGISKSENLVDFTVLESAIRDDLENTTPRIMAVLNPLKIELTNFDENLVKSRNAQFHPTNSEFGEREISLSKYIYIEQEDFKENPPAKWQRLTLNGEVRLRYSYIIKCKKIIKDEEGNIILLKCTIDYDTLGKNPADRKVKGVIHWVREDDSIEVKVRLYDRLFTVEKPDRVRDENGEYKDFTKFINPNSLIEKNAYIERGIKNLAPETRYQFERIGYFITDRYEHQENAPVFNRIVTLKDNWINKNGN